MLRSLSETRKSATTIRTETIRPRILRRGRRSAPAIQHGMILTVTIFPAQTGAQRKVMVRVFLAMAATSVGQAAPCVGTIPPPAMVKQFWLRAARCQTLPLLTLGTIMGVTMPQGTSAALQILDSINGENLAAIQTTLPSLRSRGLAPESCNIFVGAGATFVGVVYRDEKDSSKIVGRRVNPAGDLTPAEASGILMGRAGFEVRGRLNGSSLGPMIAALPVFAQQKGLHLDQYRLELI